jgi:glycosyltransferase involved in cell wall biosynthesis
VAQPTFLTVVQDIATPHNNVLLQALHARGDVVLSLWYCQPNPAQYGFKEDLANAVVGARYYHPTRPDVNVLWQLLSLPCHHQLLVVGWMNPSTKILLFLLTLTRRPFAMWFDNPADGLPRSWLKTAVREFFYATVRVSRAQVFAMGRRAVQFFEQRGFAPSRLTNLPIVVELPDLQPFLAKRTALRKKYRVPQGGVLLVCGSRLVPAKGFDLPIQALAILPKAERQNVRLVIVGKGPEKARLVALVTKHDLKAQVYFEEWLDFPDFQALMSASDAYLHPARFDAWGTSYAALAQGVPVIGSTQGGSAYELITHGKNGWLYEPEDTATLARLMTNIFTLTEVQKKHLAAAALKTMQQWQPAKGAEVLLQHLPETR